ncbi:MAG: pyridoxamine 5'-phosphate oxidase family protein [Williamsia sp.]|nr:pyridoxamine 5'-phosphate oxidase family protein [Williamsia sp.]
MTDKKDNNDNVQHLYDKEAVEKIKDLAKSANICMFTTQLTQLPLSSVPMATQEVDDEGNLWFLSGRTSHKNGHIQADPRVQLFFTNTSSSEFLSIYGTAKITADRAEIEQLWTPIAKAWFTEGKNDPELTVIKVTPEESYYWDTKNSKAVSMLKILAATVTGKTMDDGVEGKLNV